MSAVERRDRRRVWANQRRQGGLAALVVVGLALGLTLLPGAPGAPVVHGAPTAGIIPFTAAGAAPAAIQGSIDAFRAALGGANNGVGGTFPNGRREINWDGVPDAFSAPNNFPPNFFNVNSPRGVVFGPSSTSFQVSSTAASGVPVRFGNINPTYTALFQTFSPERLFSPLGTNVMDVDFLVPGTTTAATVSGFGSVFTNVNNPNNTRLQFFNRNGAQVGEVAAPPGALSWAAGQFDGADGRIARVRIITGNTALGPNNAPPAVNVVVMDDFIYGEPQATTTTTTLAVVPSVANVGQPITLTATVAATASGLGTPTGLVGFTVDGVQVGTGTLGAGGQATFTTTSIPSGTHVLAANYLGDTSFVPSASTAVTVTVRIVPAPTPTSTPLTVQPGTGQVSIITVPPPPLPPPPPLLPPLPPPAGPGAAGPAESIAPGAMPATTAPSGAPAASGGAQAAMPTVTASPTPATTPAPTATPGTSSMPQTTAGSDSPSLSTEPPTVPATAAPPPSGAPDASSATPPGQVGGPGAEPGAPPGILVEEP